MNRSQVKSKDKEVLRETAWKRQTERVFGIDFGTTNTRIAYYDGERVLAVTDRSGGTLSTQIPSAVAYKNGKPVAYGNAAIKAGELKDVCVKTSLKWLMDSEHPIDVGEQCLDPVDIAADFFKYLKEVVKNAQLEEKELKRVALTVPVNYTYRARKNLCRAVEKAGIEIIAIYHEPIAALYCDLELRRTPGLAAVFDWGGGTLDVAIVHLENEWAQVMSLDGLRLGGDDFDRTIINKAVADFYQKNIDLPIEPEDLINHPLQGYSLRRLAEQAKINISKTDKALFSQMNLVEKKSLMYSFNRRDFEQWISFDIDRAVGSVKRAIKSAQIPEARLNHILMSGGTSNIPAVQLRIKQEFGADRTMTALANGFSGKQQYDIANATAMGAAQLALNGAHPVFARDYGIRLADVSRNEDLFYPIYRKGEQIRFGQTHSQSFYISNSKSGVAQLLICDRLDEELNEAGTLLKVLTVPIEKNENHLDLSFSMDKDLALKVSATGVLAKSKPSESSCVITNVNIGFRIPGREKVSFKDVIESTC